MFKCLSSHICLHILDICDGQTDCPANDDEIQCNVLGLCPKQCVCLHLALWCKDLTNDTISLGPPFVSIQIIQSQLASALFLVKDTDLLYLNLSGNVISDVLIKNYNFLNLKFLDLSHNLITLMKKKDLFAFDHLTTVSLHCNKVENLEESSFTDLKNLTIVDLSKNQLSSFSSSVFKNSPNVRVLNLNENLFSEFVMNMFEGLDLQLTLTDNYKICCFVSKPERICTSAVPWYTNCDPGMPLVALIFAAVLSLMIVVLNVFSFLLNWRSKGPVQTIVGASNIVDTLFADYLIILWTTDLYFSFSFLAKEVQWMESFLCAFGFTLVTVFHLASISMLCFMSLARSMVVLYPFESRFKRHKFVSQCVFIGVSLLVLVSVCFVFTYKFVRRIIPTVLCSPFIDPAGSLWHVFSGMFVLCAQIVAIVFSCLAYTLLVQKMKKSEKGIRKTGEEKSHMGIIVQISILITPHCLSWVPSSLVYVSCLFLPEYPSHLLLWPTLFVAPLCSFVHPVVFVTLSLRK